MKVALIISVYKDVSSLKVILDALQFQTFKDFEIVISEDGDSPEMREFVSGYSFSNPVKHITQPDEGWRKNKALNNAVRFSSADYLIFIDGDCVLHHKFIENHLKLSSPSGIVAGKRVKMGPKYSTLFRANIGDLLKLETTVEKEMRGMKKDGAKFYEEAFYFNPSGVLGFIPKIRKMTYLKGCNMSLHKKTIEAINGFDEDYTLPAIGEDTDLTWRFRGLGFHLISARNLAVQYHLYHKENWVEQSENMSIMQKKMMAKEYICKNGLSKII
jgi:GT2 family glycosyltransferase